MADADFRPRTARDQIRKEFPDVVVTTTIIQSSSGPGATRYSAQWRGRTVTATSIPGLLWQLRDISLLGDGA